jgi:RES domain-containing protein
MVLWRISRHRDLSGAGGLKVPGRWHHAGHRVVYLAENPAAALLEVCVHTSASDIPPDFVLLKIEGPNMNPPAVSLADLPPGWPSRLDLTRNLGAAWLVSAASLLLKVPSALVPETTNFLLNPTHPNARRFRISQSYTYPFDARLKH